MIDLVLEQASAEKTSLVDEQRWPCAEGNYLVGRIVHPSHHNRGWFDNARLCREHAGVTDAMHVYQIFWPDEAGCFPWESAWRGSEQPLLFEPYGDAR